MNEPSGPISDADLRAAGQACLNEIAGHHPALDKAVHVVWVRHTLRLLDEVERLRKWNAQLTQALDFHFEAANKYCDQLAKARAALDGYRYRHEREIGMMCHCPECKVNRQVLKEIGHEY